MVDAQIIAKILLDQLKDQLMGMIKDLGLVDANASEI